MPREQKIANIREILLKYLAPDCLKPEYDGMTTHELATRILEAIDDEL